MPFKKVQDALEGSLQSNLVWVGAVWSVCGGEFRLVDARDKRVNFNRAIISLTSAKNCSRIAGICKKSKIRKRLSDVAAVKIDAFMRPEI